MNVPEGETKEFCFLQIRPLVLGVEVEDMETAEINPDDVLVESTQVLGNGVLRDIRDIVFVDINKYDRGRSRDVAREIAAFNAQLVALQRQYILIGVGRWGSKDEWLGIPVSWDQISGAAVIVESSFRDFDVTPSQGTHFFQNITSFRIGYFTVNSFSHLGRIDWEWLTQQAATAQQEFTTHVRFENPLTVRINGRKNIGVILKPS
jgi:hypothetical protein